MSKLAWMCGAAFGLVSAACSDSPPPTAVDAGPVDAAPDAAQGAGLSVGGASGPTGEGGQTAIFAVALAVAPTADVVLALASSATDEGTVISSLTFTPSTWDQAQVVTVSGVDDDRDDGDQAYAVTISATSTDPIWATLAPASVEFTNLDDDVSALTVVGNSGMTSEGGGEATLFVQLSAAPVSDVTVTFASDDPREGTTSTSLVFTAATWASSQAVTVTGVDDDIADGAIAYGLTATFNSSDPRYASAVSPPMPLVNADDGDTVGLSASLVAGNQTAEDGTSIEVAIVLDSEPVADVVVAVSSSDLTEGTVAPATVTFTAADWNVAQTVTVTGVDDPELDGAIAYHVQVGPVTSADALYEALAPSSLALVNADVGEQLCGFAGDNFDDGNVVGWSQGLATFEAGADGADGTPFFGRLTSSGSLYNGASQVFAPTQPTKVSLWMRAAAAGVAHNYVVLGDADLRANGGVLFFYANGAETSWRVVGPSGNNFYPITAGQWEFFEIELDWTTRTYDISANGTVVLADAPFRGASTSVSEMHLFSFDAAVTASYDQIHLRCDSGG